MHSQIDTEANKIRSDIENNKITPEQMFHFAEKYSGDRSLLYETILMNLLSNQDSKLRQEVYSKLLDTIVSSSSTQSGRNYLKNVRLIEKTAIERYNSMSIDRNYAVTLDQVSKSFKSSKFKLQPVSLSFKLGEITGVIGPNANGKSTLLKIIVGELLKDSGVIGYPFLDNNSKNVSWSFIKSKIAYISQDLSPWTGDLRKVLMYEASRHGIIGQECSLQVDFIIQRLGLSNYINLEWEQLSGGYKLRFELAKALVWRPSFLVLDEPLANLDVTAQMTILTDIKNLAHSFKDPICVIITSQHIHEIEHIADKLLVLESGKIIYFGQPFLFPSNSSGEIIELICDLNISMLRKILNIHGIQIEDHSYCFIIKLPEGIKSNTLLQKLNEQNVNITYFRDITNSVKQIFYENS
jgi:ABC-2 type transport system ATP-binding protein